MDVVVAILGARCGREGWGGRQEEETRNEHEIHEA